MSAVWPEITVIEHEERQSALVFGMRWSAVIGTHPRRLAAQRAGTAGASHYLCCGHRVSSVGLARFDRNKRWTYWSAAAIFAARFPQETVGAILPIGPNQYWLVASRNAAVLSRSDRLYDNHGEAHAALLRLAGDMPGLRLISYENDAQRATLFASPASSARLHALKWFRRINKVAVMSGCGLLVVVGGLIGWIHASGPQQKTEVQGEALDAQAIAAAWQMAQREAVMQAWQGGETYVPVLEYLLGVPIGVAGWALGDIECVWQSAGWRCAARYRRQTVLANNDAFTEGYSKVSGQPVDITFTPLSEARVQWRVTGEAAPVAVTGFMEAGVVASHFASRLQSIEAAFSRVQLGPPEALRVVAPLHPGSGLPLPRPVHLPALSRYRVEIEGPFRSFSILPGVVGGVAWTFVGLSWLPASPVAIEQSPLRVTLKGDVRAFDTAGGPDDPFKDDL